MSRGIVWKSCTGACMDIRSPAKYFCINCENHDSTHDVIEEEFETQYDKYFEMYLANYDNYFNNTNEEAEEAVEEASEEFDEEFEEDTEGEFEGEFEIQGNDRESRMLFMEEQMKKWTLEMGQEIASDLVDAREEIASQVIHLVSSWHLGIKREFYSSRMEKLREAMSQIMLESSINKIKYLN